MTCEDEASPRIANVYEVSKAEVADIAKWIPPKGIPREERAKLNVVVREKIQGASDLTVAYLMRSGHDLSRREFLARLNSQRITQIEAPFEFMGDISYAYIHRSELFQQAHREAVRCAPQTPVERMVDVIESFESTPMGRDDRNVFIDVLRVHPQREEILKGFRSRKAGIDWYDYWIGEIQKGIERLDQQETDAK